MSTHLFLASTPFNMLTAAMVAFELPKGDVAYLGLIDQPETEREFVTALKGWPESPFVATEVLSLQAKGKHKRGVRRQGFENVQRLLVEIMPEHLYTGNDRRIEFQFAMHLMKQQEAPARGYYIDDGTYSYLGRNTHWLKDQLIDNWVKKLSYGFWWQQPETIGASNWVDEAILAFPESAVPQLQAKQCRNLPKNLSRSEFISLANLCMMAQDSAAAPLVESSCSSDQLSGLKALLLLPHDSVADDQSKRTLAAWLSARGDHIAFKHHPRTVLNEASGDKALWQLPKTSQQVIAGLPMEVLLPLLGSDCHIAGDVSTALLTTKWLRPELEVVAFANHTTPAPWLELLAKLDIKIERI